MTLASSGQLTLNDIQGEFGGSNPIGLNEYYRGGSLVPNHGNTTPIPTSGTIEVNDFYGTSSTSPTDLVFSMTHGAATISQGKLAFDWRGAAVSSSTYIAGNVGSFTDQTVASGGSSGSVIASATQRVSGAPNSTSLLSYAWTIEFNNSTIRDAIFSGRSGATFSGLGFKSWATGNTIAGGPVNPGVGNSSVLIHWGLSVAGAGNASELALYNQMVGWSMGRQGTTDTVTFS